ncbi:hypothetical protein COCON_G00108460 [Conger conger]|uniref:Uncharacterized protein n=1 Tax=Conger conger TaxID=82655 RepID=A0A9Q1DJ46_CONCO|nr:hypothetical protein COCON_G00108460 [Conger conger]
MAARLILERDSPIARGGGRWAANHSALWPRMPLVVPALWALPGSHRQRSSSSERLRCFSFASSYRRLIWHDRGVREPWVLFMSDARLLKPTWGSLHLTRGDEF